MKQLPSGCVYNPLTGSLYRIELGVVHLLIQTNPAFIEDVLGLDVTTLPDVEFDPEEYPLVRDIGWDVYRLKGIESPGPT